MRTLEQKTNTIGKRIPLVDAMKKTTGEGLYTDDIKLPGMLVGKILRSPYPHARIKSINTEKAEALVGVHAVITGDEPGAQNRFGVLPISKDEIALPKPGAKGREGKVLYVGDCVAAVAADNEEIALEALKLLEIEWQDLRPIIRTEHGLNKTDEPLQDRTENGTNVQKSVHQHFGDVPQALKNSRYVQTHDFEFVGLNHAFTEPIASIAHYDADDRLTVWSAQQVPHYLHRSLTEVMEMPMHRIRVIRPMVGGGFGGKSDPFPHEMIAALLSRKCRRPVKILFDREEVFYNNHGRHPTKTHITVATDDKGKITALDLDATIDGGAWGSFGVVTTYYNGVLAMGPYQIPNFRYSGRRVYTNQAPCGAMRGHGAVNTRFAFEVLMDMLAEDANFDPCDFRLANLLPENTETINGFRITSNGTRECIERARERSEWDKKFRKLPFGEGIGVACGFYISGSAHRIHFNELPQSTVHLKIDMDGGITVHCMAAEIGQGSDTMLAQCVAEPLGLPLNRIRIFSMDSDTDPVDLGSYSSRVTFMAGNAAIQAAEKVRKKLVDAAHQITGYPPQGFVLKDEKLIYAPNPDISVTFDEALTQALAKNGALVAKGIYQSPPPIGKRGEFKGWRAGLSPTYSFQAYIAQVTVDPDTFEVRVQKVWAAHDCGKALNPLAVEGQIEGCIHMGLGQVLSEEMPYLKGNILGPNFLDYRTLTPMQMPDVDVIIVESNDPEGPFGAKEAGEGPLLPILPAVANAIYDAVGVRMYSLPITPDKLWKEAQRQKATMGIRSKTFVTV
ncbi:molybdopterin-dependent oxidoreductase [candidate division KSB1 bacterium]|nr:molybdopterin-dependent oxidoreductase [candidate division KSB1 bacterium]NIR72318.1 molybdopterin-dependent oxidoreductase [candidate division KSB1 bacterium]NIS26710.1 molybdopterin-dependent oxidoreductase [candidate division KSB1 bacterium]NIT73456.1 molybdopterin-dependent oxidoreductase [candidate division KSB1 bacterium]NIU27325.1 molybdopterin-dependent oxidoreductase [candidate division KSB1 bacterium]